jgi:hypothetical protein
MHGQNSSSEGAASTAPRNGVAEAQHGDGGHAARRSTTSHGADDLGANAGQASPGSGNGYPFISYVAAHPEDEGTDPDGLVQAERIALEEKAIARVLAAEPDLQRTPIHNPGFDLFEASGDGEPSRWVEVKAMTGGLDDRPVGLSHTQFACAQMHGEAYWLYVVEHAAGDSPCIVRIQDLAGKARTFTFDRGWLAIAAKHVQTQGGQH